MQNQTVAENILERFERWVLAPLQDGLRQSDRSHVVLFILISVAIDHLASLRYRGEISDRERGCVRKRYVKFIENYFPSAYKAHAALLYTGFRCKLVHEFQLDGIAIRQDEASRGKHLKRGPGNIVILNSHEFVNGLMSAFAHLKSELVGPSADPDIVAASERGGYKRWTHTT